MNRKAILIILDGWGLGLNPEVDALKQAETPFFDQLMTNYPQNTLVTHGEEVGLPDGQMGNSEVGHLNIGAGRIVYQDFTKINKAIKDEEFYQNETLLSLLRQAKQTSKKVHLIGLVSDGGVHSHIDHIKALCDATQQQQVKEVYIHAFLDGRDTSPHGGKEYISDVLQHISGSTVQLASIIGRYYAMDRDTRWERTQRAYDLLVRGIAVKHTDHPIQQIQEFYNQDITDEFMEPIQVNPAVIEDGDIVICFNFRTDRPRQITTVLTQKTFPEYHMRPLQISYAGMTKYDEDFKNVGVLFEKENLKKTLGEVIAAQNKSQLRIAETEKYPHVTFFFNGGREDPYLGEQRIVVPSPKVATYDLQPEMSALEVTTKIIQVIEKKSPDFICLNFANTDMVGHTGDFEAAKKAAQTVDNCLSELVPVCLKEDYHIIIIADHGNSDIMKNEDGTAHTAHTTNLVPIIYASKNPVTSQIKSGKLADVAPTILSLMEIEIPVEMTGEVLL